MTREEMKNWNDRQKRIAAKTRREDLAAAMKPILARRYKPLAAPRGHTDITKQLRWLAEHMIDIGVSLDYYGGFDAAMVQQGRDLVNAAFCIKGWAEDIEGLTAPK